MRRTNDKADACRRLQAHPTKTEVHGVENEKKLPRPEKAEVRQLGKLKAVPVKSNNQCNE